MSNQKHVAESAWDQDPNKREYPCVCPAVNPPFHLGVCAALQVSFCAEWEEMLVPGRLPDITFYPLPSQNCF